MAVQSPYLNDAEDEEEDSDRAQAEPTAKDAITQGAAQASQTHHLSERHTLHLRPKRIAPRAGIDHHQLVQLEVGKGHVHALGHARRVLAFDLDADAFAFVGEEEIEFRARMHTVEPGLFRLEVREHFLDHEALPRCTELGVGE